MIERLVLQWFAITMMSLVSMLSAVTSSFRSKITFVTACPPSNGSVTIVKVEKISGSSSEELVSDGVFVFSAGSSDGVLVSALSSDGVSVSSEGSFSDGVFS